MQEILLYIENKKQEFAQLPLFDFMQDRSIDPRQRLSFAPCMAHYIMSFGDLNKYVFPVIESDDPIQKIINEHSIEDSKHWPWFLIDIERLGCNHNWEFTESLKFIWSEKTQITRQISYQIIACTLDADPVIKLAAIELLEAMGNVFLLQSVSLVSELQAITKKQYIYFGETHLKVETGHTTGILDVEQVFSEIELTESQRQEAFNVVDKIFNIFSLWTDELLEYGRNYNLEEVIYQEVEPALSLN
jgi:hypothetical protein